MAGLKYLWSFGETGKYFHLYGIREVETIMQTQNRHIGWKAFGLKN